MRDCRYDGGRKLSSKGGNDHEPTGDDNLAGCGSSEYKRTGNEPSHQRKRVALTGKFDDRWRQKYLTFNSLAYGGLTIAAGTASGLIIVVVLASLLLLYLKLAEEKELAERFGDAYLLFGG